jgi:catechol 2,3-dioxygenase-like lactoylglutathione lyase family enzyme
MLGSASVSATLPVVDLKRARQFYEEILGLKLVKEDPSPGATLRAGKGTYIYLYQRGASKADHTVAAFTVDDVEAEVRQLKEKGVRFEDYDYPSLGIKTVNGIATMDGVKAAWFKDPEGNILGVSNE